ncbi:hypothetical protein ACFVYF_17835 [Streptomyces sp. NPDC058274]|uniref:hypothetical protein n=1 Tax=Streptomyces sp. NPDC058274 TaxID=3346416 RepID=UPI0036EB88CF
MYSRTAAALTAGGLAAVLAGAGWGAYALTDDGSTSQGAAASSAGTRAEGQGKAVITLPGGRKVEVRYVDGKGLGERHYDPRTKKWSKTQLIYTTKSDACQGIELAAADGTVAAIADFGPYCDDGEPPQESIAAVGTGRFTAWETNLQKSFDGWDTANVAKGGASASFVQTSEETIETLRWSKKGGFSGPTEEPRPAKKLSEKFFGSWKSEDGSQRVAVQKLGNGGVATFFTQSGERCVTRVGLYPYSETVGEFTTGYREEGDRTKNCPAYPDSDFMKLNKAGTALSFESAPGTFTKAEPNQEEQKLPSPPGPVFSVDKDWLGDWQLADGSRRVTIAEPKAEEPIATFTNTSGPRCVARAELYVLTVDQLSNIASRPPEVIEGAPAAGCPPQSVDFTLSADGRSFVQKVEGEPDVTYVRVAGSEK